jgi:hypothetical protein
MLGYPQFLKENLQYCHDDITIEKDELFIHTSDYFSSRKRKGSSLWSVKGYPDEMLLDFKFVLTHSPPRNKK